MTTAHSSHLGNGESRGHGEPQAHAPAHHVPYYAVFATLLVLTVVTVGAYFLLMAMGVTNELVRVLVALLIAAVKASLVAYFFMHLKFEGKLIYLIAVVPLILCVLLVVALIPDVLHGPLFNEPPERMAVPLHGDGHATPPPSPGAGTTADEPAH